MKITKRQLRKIIKEEIANVLEKASDKDLEEGWWPFGSDDDEKSDSEPLSSKEFLKQHRAKKAALAAAAKKKAAMKADDEYFAAKAEKEKEAAARAAKQRKEWEGSLTKAGLDQRQKYKNSKDRMEYWKFKDGRGGMYVDPADEESVAEFDRANGTAGRKAGIEDSWD